MLCNICGCTNFLAGPGGRLSATGTMPYCSGCGSLERHRALRDIYSKLFGPFSGQFKRALQISNDMVIQPGLFVDHEISIYGGDNSIDLMNIERPTNAYDWVVCNHVLEHVKDDRLAMMQLFRVTALGGVLQLSVPNPVLLRLSKDWGYPDDSRHGHYREYGREDFLPKFSSEIIKMNMAAITMIGSDPVTNTKEYAYFFSRDSSKLLTITNCLLQCS